MEFWIVSLLNGLSYGLLLFMLSSGLTLIFSLMGVLNFAHASFYMLGAYLGYALAQRWGFGWALLGAPVLVGLMGAAFERWCLRRVHALGHVPELLVTFALSYVVLELVQLVWGRTPVDFQPHAWLQGPAFTLMHRADGGLALAWGDAVATCVDVAQACTPFPATRAFMMALALVVFGGLWLLLTRTRVGLVIQAALTHPDMVGCLGHNVPRIYMWVFGVGTGLAGLAGVVGGSTFVTEPHMAATLGALTFVVVVVGGLGSLLGALLASLVIGLIQTLAISMDQSFAGLLGVSADSVWGRLTLSQLAPVLPYLLLVLVLVLRPRGLLGSRET
jgi:branched-chain amino acid transport system permease protein